MKSYESLGFFDFEDFVEELTDEQLFAINGGSCAGGSPSGGYGPTGGGSCSGGYNPGPSNPTYGGSCGGGGAVTPSNPYPTPTSACGGGYNSPNNEISKQLAYTRIEESWVPEVGIVTGNISQSCWTKNNKLTISNFGIFSHKNHVSVDSYIFKGEITLIINGVEKEKKTIAPPTGSNIWDGTKDYIGDVTFDTYIPNSGDVQIKTDIDMFINHAFVNFDSSTQKLR